MNTQQGSGPQVGQANKQQVCESTKSTNDEAKPELDLTLGIEMECLLLHDTTIDTQQSSLRFAYPRELIHDALSTPLNVECATCGVQHTFHLDLNAITEDSHSIADPHYRRWLITRDSSICTDELEDHFGDQLDIIRAHPIEIVSRVLSINTNHPTSSIDASGHIHSITYQEEIRAVTQALHNSFTNVSTAKNGWRIVLNETCGFHVHLGNGTHYFPMSTVKNMLSLYIANEKSLDSLHAFSRIDGSLTAFDGGDKTENFQDRRLGVKDTYTLPWSAQFANLAYADKKAMAVIYRGPDVFPEGRARREPALKRAMLSNDIPSRLDIIAAAKSVYELQEMQIPHGKCLTLNLENLKEFNEEGSPARKGVESKPTIEFRQHAATLDHIEMAAWIDVLVHLTQFANKYSEEEFYRICMSQWRDPAFDTMGFLAMLGLTWDTETFQHYELVLGMLENAPSQSYTAVYLERELAAIGTGEALLERVQRYCAEENAKDRRPSVVRKRIATKLLVGCYGKFEAQFIEDLAYDDDWPSLEGKERLKLE